MPSLFIEVSAEKCELEGPYECPGCGGHVMLDATFLDQVQDGVSCPYCKTACYVPIVDSDTIS